LKIAEEDRDSHMYLSAYSVLRRINAITFITTNLYIKNAAAKSFIVPITTAKSYSDGPTICVGAPRPNLQGFFDLLRPITRHNREEAYLLLGQRVTRELYSPFARPPLEESKSFAWAYELKDHT